MKSRKFRTCNPTLQWNTPLPVNQNNLPVIIVFLTSANILLSFATCAKWYTIVLNTTESRKQRVVAECTLSHTGLTAWNLLNEKLCTITIDDTTDFTCNSRHNSSIQLLLFSNTHSHAGIVFTKWSKNGFFTPQGQHIAPTNVKFDTKECTKGLLPCAKFYIYPGRNVGIQPPKLSKFQILARNLPLRGHSFAQFLRNSQILYASLGRF